MEALTPPLNRAPRHEEFVALLTGAPGKRLGSLLSLLGRWHDAEEVLQRASSLMWQKFDVFESGNDFVAKASTLCFYEARNFQRLSARSPAAFDADLLETLAAERLADLTQQERRMAALEGGLRKLPRHQSTPLQNARREKADTRGFQFPGQNVTT